MAGFAIFSVLGFMTYEQGVDISEVAESGKYLVPNTTSYGIVESEIFGCTAAVQPEHVNSWAGVSVPRDFGRGHLASRIRRCIFDSTGRLQEVLLSRVKYEVSKLNLKQRKHSWPLALNHRRVARSASFNIHKMATSCSS